MTGCPACGAAEAAGRGLLRCPVCGLVFREEKHFGDPVYADGLEEGIYGDAKAGLFSTALDFLGAGRAPGRLLDIGCASGVFLKAAAGRGWKAEGVELSAGLADKAAVRGFAVARVSVEKAGLQGGAYDAVTVFEVFCLMDDPAAAAAEIARLLRPGGAVYIREFNAAFHLPLYRLELAGVFAPFGLKPSVIHNFNFTARSLRAMLERAGLRQVRVRNSPPTSGDPYRTGGKLGGFLTAGLKFLYYMLAEALYYLSFGRVLAGSSLIAVARK